ncbi:hypothetical protein D3C76_421450 [compost metagenome]
MAGLSRWRAKRDGNGKVLPRCWQSEDGYTVSEARIPEARYAITAPGGKAPFEYTSDLRDIRRLIEADMKSRVTA